MANDGHFRIGTRDSQLATWQAEQVKTGLQAAGFSAELVFIKTKGDLVLDTPLPMIGGKGLFTKALDDAQLAGEIDIAVHSYKDLPTELPEGLAIGAVLKRADPRDALVLREGQSLPESSNASFKLATGSTRRRAQWQRRYPKAELVDLRGNVNTRLRKVAESDWLGAIFAAAGLHRIGLGEHISQKLNWMLPAPAQGAIAVTIREGDQRTRKALLPQHSAGTYLLTQIERDFLQGLEGGCSAPLGAQARMFPERIHFDAILLTPDGQTAYELHDKVPMTNIEGYGKIAADKARREGAEPILEAIAKTKQT